MSSLIGTILAKRRIQNVETLLYYVLCTLFPLLGYLHDQDSEFLKLWMANHGLGGIFYNLIKYYTTNGNGTILKKEYTTIENHTLLAVNRKSY